MSAFKMAGIGRYPFGWCLFSLWLPVVGCRLPVLHWPTTD